MHPYIEYVNPHLGKTLMEIGLDKHYVKGESCYLYDQSGKSYLDFIAAYGALPFGFNPPEIWEAINQIQAISEPSFVQPSLLDAAGQLGKRLVEIAPPGLTTVTFANSGAEAVEAAIKLARARTGKRGILTTHRSFHGKTLGALSATGNTSYQKAFGAPVEGFYFIPYGDLDQLEAALAAKSQELAAFIIEPIQGEGGIVQPPVGYLKEAKALCEKYNVLIIFDEIQTGLGRTGKMFGCDWEGVTPDIMTLAKALGGGIVPIGAVLCTDDVYTEEFATKHSSTFAGNTLACRVGLKVIELLTRDNQQLIKEVARKGEILKHGLLAIQAKYPQIVQEVRGRGFMLGIDFGNRRDLYPDSLLGIMAEQQILTPMIASYLLNVEQLRVAPTLNGASVIRIEPPLVVTDEHIQLALQKVERVVAMLARRNTAAFLGHLIGVDVVDDNFVSASTRTPVEPLNTEDEGRFAFLIHPLDMENYPQFDESLRVFTDEQLSELANRWSDLVEPFLVASTRITSKAGKTAFGDFIAVPRTAEELQKMPPEQALDEIKAAVDLAVSRGAKIVGLGAYTSVVTAGGRSLLKHVDVPLTTGNGYTVLSGVEALMVSAEKLNMELNTLTAAIVGAGGAIGKASAILLSEHVRELILIGNPANPQKSEYRMLKVIAEMFHYLARKAAEGVSFKPHSIGAYVQNLSNKPAIGSSLSEWIEFARQVLTKDCPISYTVDIQEHLPKADIILAATSSTEAMITSQLLKQGALICDMSRPTNVSKEVLEKRDDVLVIDGGVIEVPGKPDLGWDFGFESGTAYACMSETMMLALEQRYENTSIGADLNIDFLNYLADLAKVHGFKLAGFRSFDLPLPEEQWEKVVKARKETVAAQQRI
ncbi:MAG: aminotransferase class III-fold pyridoxal phosphate-dependent enzyme [Firmicutes bacterium]|nr:aminotransferase class III-fold pyridoxal phosphate-dependent enzyme [Bacillota bacterium]